MAPFSSNLTTPSPLSSFYLILFLTTLLEDKPGHHTVARLEVFASINPLFLYSPDTLFAPLVVSMRLLVGKHTLTRPSLPFLPRGCWRATYVALTAPNILQTERKKGVEHRLSDRTGCVAFEAECSYGLYPRSLSSVPLYYTNLDAQCPVATFRFRRRAETDEDQAGQVFLSQRSLMGRPESPRHNTRGQRSKM